MQLIKNSNIDFTSKTMIASIVSITFIVIGISSLIYRGGPSLSIDFTGGNIAQLKLAEAVDISNIRLSLSENGLPGAEIIEFGSPQEILIKTQYEGTGKELLEILNKGISSPFSVERFEAIGPKIGSETQSDAINAILIALLLISIYISFRFDRLPLVSPPV